MRGGELTYGPLSQWQPSFAEAAGELKPGQLSEIVETEFGFISSS